MFDPAMASAMASLTVETLMPILKRSFDESAEKLDKSSSKTLVDRLKQKFTHVGVKDALIKLSSQHDDNAAQGALVIQLQKALVSDPNLEAFLGQWTKEAKSVVVDKTDG